MAALETVASVLLKAMVMSVIEHLHGSTEGVPAKWAGVCIVGCGRGLKGTSADGS